MYHDHYFWSMLWSILEDICIADHLVHRCYEYDCRSSTYLIIHLGRLHIQSMRFTNTLNNIIPDLHIYWFVSVICIFDQYLPINIINYLISHVQKLLIFPQFSKNCFWVHLHISKFVTLAVPCMQIYANYGLTFYKSETWTLLKKSRAAFLWFN